VPLATLARRKEAAEGDDTPPATGPTHGLIERAVRVGNWRSGQDVIEAAGRANGKGGGSNGFATESKESALKRTAIWS